MKRVDNLFFFVFLIVLFLPSLDSFIGFLPTNENNEKRVLLNEESSKNLYSKVHNYISDYDRNFSGRTALIKLFINLKMLLPEKNPLPQKVVLGKNEYYFLSDFNCMDDYRNIKKWSDFKMFYFVNKLLANKKYLDSKGIIYMIVVVPDKQKIYPEYLPDRITRVSETSQLNELEFFIDKYKVPIDIVNLFDTLNSNKQLGLYLKGDSHWNYLGSYLGYRYVLNKIKNKSFALLDKNESFYLSDYKETDLDLLKMLGEDASVFEISPRFIVKDNLHVSDAKLNFVVNEEKKKNRDSYIISKTCESGEKKMLMFRDSYSSFWVDYFSVNFKESIFVWQYNFDAELVNQINPDIVIQQVAERHLDLIN
jgi:hypothetical protein